MTALKERNIENEYIENGDQDIFRLFTKNVCPRFPSLLLTIWARFTVEGVRQNLLDGFVGLFFFIIVHIHCKFF